MATTEQFVRLDDEKLGRLYDRACRRCADEYLKESKYPHHGGYPCRACFIAEVKETRAKLNSPHRPKGQ